MVEAILKIVTRGFLNNGPNSYLRSPWDCLDFTIVLISFLDIVLSSISSLQLLKILRTVRLLRPIRIIAVSRSLKSAITSLVKSIPRIMELLGLVILVIFLFAMLWVKIFSGKFHYCYVEHLDMKHI